MGPTSMAPDELNTLIGSQPKKQYYNWNTYYRLVVSLKNKIKTKPNIVVSIGKGGSIPGVILAEHFDINNLNIGLKSYNNFNQTKMIEYQSLPSYESLRGAFVLLVDDLADTGTTFKYAIDKFKEKGVEYVETASVFRKAKSTFIPDYFVEEVPSDVWIVQPWEYV
jgi:hypoxanthine phosphoribosyltransferase